MNGDEQKKEIEDRGKEEKNLMQREMQEGCKKGSSGKKGREATAVIKKLRNNFV